MPREKVRTRLLAREARPQASSEAGDARGNPFEAVKLREECEVFLGGQFVVEQRAVGDHADETLGRIVVRRLAGSGVRLASET